MAQLIDRRTFTKWAVSATALFAGGAFMAGCSNSRGTSSDSATSASATSSTSASAASASASAGSSVLVIYYSRADENYSSSGLVNLTVGNTEVMAGYIANALQCDTFKVEPATAYPTGYNDCCDQAKQELNNNARPTVGNMASAPDLSKYQTILVGAPVWWGHHPCTLSTYLESQDFTGKTVIPFATSAGSGLGSVVEDCKTSCKGATVSESQATFQLGESIGSVKEEVVSWAKGLNLGA